MSNFDDIAVENFREYLRIPSVHPNPDYEPCVEFIKRQAKQLDLPVEVYEPVQGKPIVVVTWQGTEPQLPAIMLNSHMDVVPVYEDSWTYKPFEAHMDADGNIYARGAQDTKGIGIQYLEAVRRLKHRDITLRRSVHITFVPDEEIGGLDGMRTFVKTEYFKNLNIGFALDEGSANITDEIFIYNGERTVWQLFVHCPGNTGHGSLLLDNTAGEKVRYIIDKFMDFRAEQKRKLTDNPDLNIGDVTSVNLTIIEGGVQVNVVPEELIVVFDVRIAVTVDIVKFEQMINSWCKAAGQDVWIFYKRKDPQAPVTVLDDSNPYWLAFKEAAKQLNIAIQQKIMPGGTDAKYMRPLGLPVIGFSPMNKTKPRAHGHDEYLNRNVFLTGIDIYSEIITKVANVEQHSK